MNKCKVLCVMGTRPEAIKMAPLVLELRKRPEIDCRVCVTAQHREMLDMVLDLFGITPDYDLNIMTPSQTLCTIAARVISGMEGVLRDFAPDVTLVHGDTTTTAAGALAAFYCGALVGHVEAGLRTYDRRSPYPEEVNRMMAGAICELHFAPTENNRQNLLRENIREGITVTGNTVIDALKYTVRDDFAFRTAAVADAVASGRRIVLLTAHRRENFGRPHDNIFEAARQLALRFPDTVILYPVHPNPALNRRAHEMLDGIENIVLTKPLDTDEMHNLMARSTLILTDSGGLQEEGPALGKPVLVLRRETERPEAVAAGTVKISGTETDDIVRDASALLTDPVAYAKMARAVNPYGDGRACERIADAILFHFGLRDTAPADFTGR